jgi:acyl-CoA hydrolase
MTPETRTPDDSVAVHTTTVLPADTNAYGNLFGGHLVALVDKTASITASRHARLNVVTASIDRVDFHQPVRLGDILTVESRLTYTGRTSMEIETLAWAENRITGDRVHACHALLTFVAIDEEGRPAEVPPLQPRDDAERRRFEAGRARAQARKAARTSPPG